VAVAEEDAEELLLFRDNGFDPAQLLRAGGVGAGGAGGEKGALDLLHEKLARKDIRAVDHGAVAYLPVRKHLYVEHPEVGAQTEAEAASLRTDWEIKLRGKRIPKPLWRWAHAGLPDALVVHLESRGMLAPFAVQGQALPVIFSGRDVIGVAKTGSGKTLAYLLPLLRHIRDQPPLAEGDGPVGLILAPSRELVTQIYKEAVRVGKPLGVRAAAVYGGTSVAEQIADLKRGAEIVVCTPGRMIDVLTLNQGKVLPLTRVSFVVLDEADRMFDLGFEPQIARILLNVRPDRQTVMFSATFPAHVEAVARKVLRAPVEIVVGGRSVASADIQQFVEVRHERDKFPRVLQLLGHWHERGSVIVFVDTKEHCDILYSDLMRHGYPALSLHGGKDQVDRDQTLADFRSKVATVLIATSVAGRGLDVKDCVLVVNYSCPNHLEDYVHRVGRTGRAGRTGTAFTFIRPDEQQYAGDLVRALREAKQEANIPEQLRTMAMDHERKVAAGEAKRHRSGFGAGQKGFRFDESEQTAAQNQKDAQRRAYEVSSGLKDISEVLAEDEEKRQEAAAAGNVDEREAEDFGMQGQPTVAVASASVSETVGLAIGNGESKSAAISQPDGEAAAQESTTAEPADAEDAALSLRFAGVKCDSATLMVLRAKVVAAQTALRAGRAVTDADVKAAEEALATAEAAALFHQQQQEKEKQLLAQQAAAAAAASAFVPSAETAKAAAAAAADKVLRQLGIGAASQGADAGVFTEELEINDYPVQARSKVVRKEVQGAILDFTRCAITVKGVYTPPGRRPPPGERKVYLLIEGRNEAMVRKTYADLRRVLEEETLKVGLFLDRQQGTGGANLNSMAGFAGLGSIVGSASGAGNPGSGSG
jgi:ATP-dependent RNA helicase DDX46/PRP5